MIYHMLSYNVGVFRDNLKAERLSANIYLI
jgi:hypothetical protein